MKQLKLEFTLEITCMVPHWAKCTIPIDINIIVENMADIALHVDFIFEMLAAAVK